MKIEKKTLVILGFIVSLVVFLLIILVMNSFKPGLKDLIEAFYFAVWVAAVLGVWAFIISPYLKEKSWKKKVKVSAKEPEKPKKVVLSPNSDLPLNERIRLYVTEKRKEEGLPVPEPLVIGKTVKGPIANIPSAPLSSIGSSAPVNPNIPTSNEVISAHNLDESDDLPFPDDFDDMGGEDSFMGDMDEDAAGDMDLSVPSSNPDESDELNLPGEGDADEDELPDLDDNLELFESDFGEEPPSDKAEPDEVPESKDEEEEESLPDFPPNDGGGDELPDIDEIELDENMMESDLSGDDDLMDIEFDDLEPEDEKGSSK